MRKKIKPHRTLVTLSAFVIGALAANAATVNFDNYWNGSPGNFKSAFNNAQNAAGNNGTIKFSAKNYKTNQSIEINKSGLKLDGAGMNSTGIFFDAAAFGSNTVINYLFKVNSNGIKVEDLTASGPFMPSASDDLDDRPPTTTRGIQYVFSISSGKKNFSATRVKMRNASNVIRGYKGDTFDGGRLVDCVFERFHDALMFKDSGDTRFRAMGSKFIINNCEWIENAYETDYGRGCTMDYGNYASDLTLVDLKWSEFKNNSMDQCVRWNVDFNRIKNLSITSNVIYGGGGENNPDWFHPLHFEDNPQNVVIGNLTDSSKGNEIHQLVKKGSAEAGGSSWLISVQSEGNEPYASPAKAFNIGNNNFHGVVWRGLRFGSGLQNGRIEANNFKLNINDSVLSDLIFVARYDNQNNSVDYRPKNKINGTAITNSQENNLYEIQ